MCLHRRGIITSEGFTAIRGYDGVLMSVKEKLNWITGEEIGDRRRALLKAGIDDDSPEMEELWKLVRDRDEYFWDRYAAPKIATHHGKWAAVSLDGDLVIRPTASAAITEGTKRFGEGNFVHGKLAEFRGHDLSRC